MIGKRYGERGLHRLPRLKPELLVVLGFAALIWCGIAAFDDARIVGQPRLPLVRAIEIGAAATVFILLLGGVWRRQQHRSAASRRTLLLALDHMSQGIVMIDADGCIPVVNRRAVELLDLPPALSETGREMRKAQAALLKPRILPEGNMRGEGAQGILKRGSRVIETLSQYLPGGGLVRTFTDVTERRIADARVRHMAHHDPLTGLANRVLLNEQIAEYFHQPASGPLGLICFDLDGFKTVNDTLGHDAGDRVLRELGRRMQCVVGTAALLARIGDNQFAVLSSDGTQPRTTDAIAAAIGVVMQDPVEIDGTLFRLSASLGLAFSPEDGTTAQELLKHADTAMHQAKSRGRGLVVRFDAEMDFAHREREIIERDLRHALHTRALDTWFQPRVEAGTLRVSGFEALARWRHPERGFISPSVFIPIAEQCGLIGELGMQILEAACAFAASRPNGRIAVNLSPVQFLSDNLAQLIGDMLAEYGLTPDRLELEITEGVLIADEGQALRTLQTLHDRGFHLALDDFGTGFASLSYLRNFPFDRIKIDQSFVRGQEHDPTTRAIVECIMTMAGRLRLEVTAEGVETERQLQILLSRGCPEVQGFLLGRPMPASEARTFQVSMGGIATDREPALALAPHGRVA